MVFTSSYEKSLLQLKVTNEIFLKFWVNKFIKNQTFERFKLQKNFTKNNRHFSCSSAKICHRCITTNYINYQQSKNYTKKLNLKSLPWKTLSQTHKLLCLKNFTTFTTQKLQHFKWFSNELPLITLPPKNNPKSDPYPSPSTNLKICHLVTKNDTRIMK